MTRRDFLVSTGAIAGGIALTPGRAIGSASMAQGKSPLHRISPPKGGPIKVAFLISENFEVIDFAGPWEIFQDVVNPATQKPAFQLYTVSRSDKAVKASGGLKVMPEHSFESAELPNVLVIPAQSDDSAEVLSWIRKVAAHTDVTMSVCTGAFLLAKAGLLDGLKATTYHGAYKLLSVNYPHVHVQQKVRYVDNGRVATSSGLSAGIDLALHVVHRYFGESVADNTAADLEYVGYGWKEPHNTGDLFERLHAQNKGRTCPVCEMGPIGTDIALLYKGKTYYFCSEACKKTFLKRPQEFVAGY